MDIVSTLGLIVTVVSAIAARLSHITKVVAQSGGFSVGCFSADSA